MWTKPYVPFLLIDVVNEYRWGMGGVLIVSDVRFRKEATWRFIYDLLSSPSLSVSGPLPVPPSKIHHSLQYSFTMF